MIRIEAMTSVAACGPSRMASSTPPPKCPLVPGRIGKLIIWAAKTNAPITPMSGTLAGSKIRPVRHEA